MMLTVTRLFPLWALLASAAAFALPAPFAALEPSIAYLLGAVMFGMGMSLTLENFRAVLRAPQLIGFGVLLQYTLMPALAWGIAALLGLPPELAAGLILVGAAPGGTASNVICYLAGGNVALSILVTASSTLLAVVATPLLTWLYVGERVPVPAGAMLVSVAQIVLVPVLLGVLINTYAHRYTRRLRAFFPLLSVLMIVLIIAIIVALNRARLADVAGVLVLAIALHNGAGLALGYGLTRAMGAGRRTARTLAIEVGMQNSGLAVALAMQFFGAAAALPGALFSIWHNLSGALLAAWWRRGSAGLRRARRLRPETG